MTEFSLSLESMNDISNIKVIDHLDPLNISNSDNGHEPDHGYCDDDDNDTVDYDVEYGKGKDADDDNDTIDYDADYDKGKDDDDDNDTVDYDVEYEKGRDNNDDDDNDTIDFDVDDNKGKDDEDDDTVDYNDTDDKGKDDDNDTVDFAYDDKGVDDDDCDDKGAIDYDDVNGKDDFNDDNDTLCYNVTDDKYIDDEDNDTIDSSVDDKGMDDDDDDDDDDVGIGDFKVLHSWEEVQLSHDTLEDENSCDVSCGELENLLCKDNYDESQSLYFVTNDGKSVVRIGDDGFASLEREVSEHNDKDLNNLSDDSQNSYRLSFRSEEEFEKSEQSHLCEICGQNFSTFLGLKLHMHMLHPVTALVASEDSLVLKNGKLCDLKHDTPRSELVCYMLGMHSDAKNFIHAGMIQRCKNCYVSFVGKAALKSHKCSVNFCPAKKYICGDCGKNYTSSTSLNAHVSMVHRRQRCMCEVCGKYYASKYYLKLHRKIHSETKDYTCGFCAKAFIDQQALRLHLRTHTGERPYRCPLCGLGFTQSSHLKTHSRLHTGEKPFKCKICGKQFRQQSNVMEHERTHLRGSVGGR